MNPDTNYVACLTAPGTSALATIGILGPYAWALVKPLFQPRGKQQPSLGQENQHWLGRLTEEGLGDEVVLTLSGTQARHRVELHGHGGHFIQRWIVDSLVSRGAVEITWQKWQMQTAPNRLQGAIAHALTQAPTLRTANILLEQMNGVLEQKLQQVFALRHVDPNPTLDDLLAWTDFGLHLTQPWRVVITGAPNAGKSSLVNALLGYQRAITAEVPGTTRDVLTARTAFDGWPVELIDTAGLRSSRDAIEVQGIDRATTAAQHADLVVWLADLTTPVLPPNDWPPPRHEFLPPVRVLVVGNKADQVTTVPPWAEATVSALTGQGVPELIQRITSILVPRVPPAGTAIPISSEMAGIISLANLKGNNWPEAWRILTSGVQPFKG